MKLAVIALLAIVLVGGGAAGAYFYFDQPAVASGGPVDEAAKAAHEARAAEAAKARQALFVALEPLILPLIDERGVTQTITMVVSIEAPDQAAADEIMRLQPRLKDAYIQDMYGTLSRKATMKDGVLQVDIIKQRLNRASVKVLGEDKVNDVLLQIVQQRRV